MFYDHFLSGTPTDQIKIEYIKIDSRGNIIEKVVWPDVTFQN